MINFYQTIKSIPQILNAQKLRHVILYLNFI